MKFLNYIKWSDITVSFHLNPIQWILFYYHKEDTNWYSDKGYFIKLGPIKISIYISDGSY